MTASKLRAIMRLNGLSQTAVSELFGVSLKRVHRWFHGKTKIPESIELGLRQRGYNVDDAQPSWIDEI
jgi:transcriptional regulator with XRE-family HTH domain